MARYFVDKEAEIEIHFAYNPHTDDIVISPLEDLAGYEKQWMCFQQPNWEDISLLWEESSRPTEEGITVIDPLILLLRQFSRLLKSWSFSVPIGEWPNLQPNLASRMAVELSNRLGDTVPHVST